MAHRTKFQGGKECVSLKHASAVLGRTSSCVDSLVRRDKLVAALGNPGRGGQYYLDLDGMVLVDMAARLDDLRVPKKKIKLLVEQACKKLETPYKLAVVYSPKRADVLEIDEHVSLADVVHDGATVEIIAPRQKRQDILRRLSEEDAPRRRGRPKLDTAWTAAKLDSADALGDDNTSADELAQMIGDRGTLPWRRDS